MPKISNISESGFVNVFYHGLSISSFTQKGDESPTGRLETAILREETHNLSVKIYEINIETGQSSLIEEFDFQDGTTKKSVELKIKATKKPLVSGFRKHLDNQTFTRDKGNFDNHDFRWIPDIEGVELLGKSISWKSNNSIPLSKMSIQNAEFYCSAISSSNNSKYFMSNENDWSDFGHIGYGLGAKLDAKEVQLSIIYKGNPNKKIIFKFNNKDLFRYEIKIDNLAPNVETFGEESDFHHYFKFTDIPENEKFNFGTIEDVVSDSGQSGPRKFCGGIIAGETFSLSNLFAKK
jgi:hypothetical protein